VIGVKVCGACREPKPLAEFYRNRWLADGLANACGACCRERNRRYRAAYPEHTRETARKAKLKKKYGLTAAEYDALLADQGGGCAICAGIEPGGRWNTRFFVDHDHITGAVRGLLCNRCNVVLGNADDDPDRLRRAAAYLEEEVCKQQT
jgi:hypothetical protein